MSRAPDRLPDYGTSVIDPGSEIVIIPAHMHVQVQVLSSVGCCATIVTPPGTHGALVAGMQGCGVRTPSAADVAAATWGLAMLLHMPNGMMLVIGAKSWMFAAGWLLHTGRPAGTTTRLDGDVPKEHMSIALLTTCIGINRYSTFC
jgi:hypothetical protein